jgi:type VI protein secretion system component VasF
MHDPHEDGELRGRFVDLRWQVAARTPSFARTHAAVDARRPLARRRRPWRIIAAGGLAAGMGLWLLAHTRVAPGGYPRAAGTTGAWR